MCHIHPDGLLVGCARSITKDLEKAQLSRYGSSVGGAACRSPQVLEQRSIAVTDAKRVQLTREACSEAQPVQSVMLACIEGKTFYLEARRVA